MRFFLHCLLFCPSPPPFSLSLPAWVFREGAGLPCLEWVEWSGTRATLPSPTPTLLPHHPSACPAPFAPLPPFTFLAFALPPCPHLASHHIYMFMGSVKRPTYSLPSLLLSPSLSLMSLSLCTPLSSLSSCLLPTCSPACLHLHICSPLLPCLCFSLSHVMPCLPKHWHYL